MKKTKESNDRTRPKTTGHHWYNLNISRYISTAEAEEEVDLQATHAKLESLAQNIEKAREKHNAFLKELGLPALP